MKASCPRLHCKTSQPNYKVICDVAALTGKEQKSVWDPPAVGHALFLLACLRWPRHVSRNQPQTRMARCVVLLMHLSQVRRAGQEEWAGGWGDHIQDLSHAATHFVLWCVFKSMGKINFALHFMAGCCTDKLAQTPVCLITICMERNHRHEAGSPYLLYYCTLGLGEIAFCAITSSEQVKGFGARLMNYTKSPLGAFSLQGAVSLQGGLKDHHQDKGSRRKLDHFPHRMPWPHAWGGDCLGHEGTLDPRTMAHATPKVLSGVRNASVLTSSGCPAECGSTDLQKLPLSSGAGDTVAACSGQKFPPKDEADFFCRRRIARPFAEYACTEDKLSHFLTYADNNAVGYFMKQGFTKEITLEKERAGHHQGDCLRRGAVRPESSQQKTFLGKNMAYIGRIEANSLDGRHPGINHVSRKSKLIACPPTSTDTMCAHSGGRATSRTTMVEH
eukprot:1159001-Pelagomonas_calceolata.AAC.15